MNDEHDPEYEEHENVVEDRGRELSPEEQLVFEIGRLTSRYNQFFGKSLPELPVFEHANLEVCVQRLIEINDDFK